MRQVNINRGLALDFAKNFPDQVSEALEGTSVNDVVEFIREASPQTIAPLLHHLDLAFLTRVLEHLGPAQIKPLLHQMSSYGLVRFLSQLEDMNQADYIALLEPSLRQEVSDLMHYPEDSAGYIMDPRVCTLQDHLTVTEALKKIRKFKLKISEVYVVDSDNRYQGTLSLVELALAKGRQTVASLSKSPPVWVNDTTLRQEVVELLEKKRLLQIPVLDFDQMLKGVIRQDALVAAIQDEASTDLQAMVGVSRDERALSSPFFSFKKRHPWLQVNLLTAFIAASVVGLFEATIAQFTALAVLLPVVAGQSGNTGSQAMAVVMRGLALREIRPKHWVIMFFKETRVGLMNGLGIAITTSLGVYLWSASYGLAAIICFSMITSMVIASVAGASVPIILMKLRQDPATSSSIILTTVTDVFGFFSFLGIATVLSSWL
jgi:magnesium transporter